MSSLISPSDEPFESGHEESFAREGVVAQHFYAQTRVYFDRSVFDMSRERVVALAREAFGEKIAQQYGDDFYYCGAWRRTFSLDIPPHFIGGTGDSEGLIEDPFGKLPLFLERMRGEIPHAA